LSLLLIALFQKFFTAVLSLLLSPGEWAGEREKKLAFVGKRRERSKWSV
jgi:hypothetical protein